jgi:ribonuclease J
MSKIEFVALGGLDEKGKNCYSLSINDNIFVINAGVSIPSVPTLGVHGFIPDFTYIIENSSNVRGVFIGTGIEQNFGGLSFLFKNLNAPIYAPKIAQNIIANYFNENNFNFVDVEPFKNIVINGITVIPFKITNCISDSVGYIFSTEDENIIYMDDCIINTSKKKYLENDLIKVGILLNGKKNILITSCGLVSTQNGFSAPKYSIKPYLSGLLEDVNDRIILGLYSFDIYRLISVL